MTDYWVAGTSPAGTGDAFQVDFSGAELADVAVLPVGSSPGLVSVWDAGGSNFWLGRNVSGGVLQITAFTPPSGPVHGSCDLTGVSAISDFSFPSGSVADAAPVVWLPVISGAQVKVVAFNLSSGGVVAGTAVYTPPNAGRQRQVSCSNSPDLTQHIVTASPTAGAGSAQSVLASPTGGGTGISVAHTWDWNGSGIRGCCAGVLANDDRTGYLLDAEATPDTPSAAQYVRQVDLVAGTLTASLLLPDLGVASGAVGWTNMYLDPSTSELALVGQDSSGFVWLCRATTGTLAVTGLVEMTSGGGGPSGWYVGAVAWGAVGTPSTDVVAPFGVVTV